MSIQKAWWDMTSCGVRFFAEVRRCLEQETSILLHGSRTLPWPMFLYEKLLGANINATRAFEILDAAKIQRPSCYVFEKFCPPNVQRTYWPDPPKFTHAHFLAQQDSIPLNHRFIVVRNFTSEVNFSAWLDFVVQYIRAFKKAGHAPSDRAVFILEQSGSVHSDVHVKELQTIEFHPQEVDLLTYNLINTSGLSTRYQLNKYAAELVEGLCAGDIEMSGHLAACKKLIEKPVATFRVFSQSFSAGNRPLSDEQARSAVVLSQIKVFYPIIEQRRRQIVEQYYSSIHQLLPLTDEYQSVKTEPYALELRELLFRAADIGIEDNDLDTIRALREIRNHLAHNKMITMDEILFLIE